jgi:SAM-dependent methyltransferase
MRFETIEKVDAELTARQRCAMVLRRLRILQLADQLFFCYLLFRQRKKNQSFRIDNPSLAIPPMPILYDILGTCDVEGYFVSGREHASRIRDIICQHQAGKPLKVLEWGCGPARVLQHLQPPSGQKWELFGSDYNPRTIEWCQANYRNIEFHNNNLGPPLNIESEKFDVIYCISVFTHLSEELHYQWIQEMLRLLKPGGLFISTFHGKNYRKQLCDKEKLQFDSGELVVRDKIREGKKNFTAYHGDRFVKKLLSPFSTSWFFEDPCFRQTVWCAIK